MGSPPACPVLDRRVQLKGTLVLHSSNEGAKTAAASDHRREVVMPKLLFARCPLDEREARQVRKVAGSRHAPGDWILRARIIIRSWEGLRTTAIAHELGCHPQTVRERISRFNAEGLDGLGNRPGAGRKPRLTEPERGTLIRLARSVPPGKAVRVGEGIAAPEPDQEAQWSLTRSPVPPTSRASRSHGASSGASCSTKGCVGGIHDLGPSALTRTSSQKRADRHPLHPAAGGGDGPLSR